MIVTFDVRSERQPKNTRCGHRVKIDDGYLDGVVCKRPRMEFAQAGGYQDGRPLGGRNPNPHTYHTF